MPKGAWHRVETAGIASKSRSAGEPKGAWHRVEAAGIASKSRSAGEPKGAWHLAGGCMVALVCLEAVLEKKGGLCLAGRGASWLPLEFRWVSSETPSLVS